MLLKSRPGHRTGSTRSCSEPTTGVYHKWWDGTAWTGYEALGGICMSPPRVATWGPNRLDVFVLGTDRALYHKWWDGTAWNGFEYLGGICMSPPEVVAWGPDRLDVFVLGTDNAVYHKWWDGSAWNDFEYLGGICASPADRRGLGSEPARPVRHRHRFRAVPQVVRRYVVVGRLGEPRRHLLERADGRVVGREPAGRLRRRHGLGAVPPVVGRYVVVRVRVLGGICIDEPRVTSWGSDRLDVFVVGTDGGLYHKWWDGTAWGPSITGYEALGGVVSDFRLDQPVPTNRCLIRRR